MTDEEKEQRKVATTQEAIEILKRLRPHEQRRFLLALEMREKYGRRGSSIAMELMSDDFIRNNKDFTKDEIIKQVEEKLDAEQFEQKIRDQLLDAQQKYRSGQENEDDKPFYIKPANATRPVRVGRFDLNTDNAGEFNQLDTDEINELKRKSFEKYGDKGFQLASEILLFSSEMTQNEFWEEFDELKETFFEEN